MTWSMTIFLGVFWPLNGTNKKWYSLIFALNNTIFTIVDRKEMFLRQSVSINRSLDAILNLVEATLFRLSRTVNCTNTFHILNL